MSIQEPPALVTVDIWTVPTRGVPAALLRMASRNPKQFPGLQFSKLLGTGSGTTFAARDITPHRWAMVCSWQTTQAARAAEPAWGVWHGAGGEHWHADLQPLSARGAWSGQRPFGAPAKPSEPVSGPIAAITRARLSWRHVHRFRRAGPRVSQDLAGRSGLLFRMGIGESPLGRQGTFSLWRSTGDLIDFAYRDRAHQQVVTASRQEGWYAEDLFARFAVLATSGTVDGRRLPGPDAGP